MTYDFTKAKVLIVDDMQPMLTLTASLLTIFGFDDIHTAISADEAFRKFCEINPDIVITDWLMEPYDGTDLIRQIRTSPKSPNQFVPVIMMTGYSHQMRVEQARDSGVTEFLVKPFKARDLYRRIEQLIEKPRRFVEAEQFFGPDRRRKKPGEYMGPFRRDVDEFAETASPDEDDASALLRQLKDQARHTARDDAARDGEEE